MRSQHDSSIGRLDVPIDTRRFRSTVAATVAVILAGPAVVCAQTADSTLRGQAPPSASITAKNLATGVVRHTTASADGTYVLAGLQPGTYRVDAGPDTAQDITVAIASTEVYDFVAVVKVLGTRLAETRTSEVGALVTLHDIDVAPQVTRNFLEFADQVPGMQFQVDAKGNTSLRGGAQLTSNINVYIDGVSQKDYVALGGGVTGQSGAGQNGDPGNPFPQLAIDQYKVITSNYKAEFGDAASSIIVAQTKSGTNGFSGEAFGNFTNQNLRAATPAEIASATLSNPKNSSPSYEYGFAQGGPIIRDVAHFFVTWEHKELSEQNTVFPGGGVAQSALRSLLPAGVYAQFGPTNNPFKEDLVFGKLDFEPGDSDRLELTGKVRTEKQVAGGQGQTAASAATHYKNDDTRFALLWQHSADFWVNEMRFTYQNAKSSTAESSGSSPQQNYVYFPNPPQSNPNYTAIAVGGPGSGSGTLFMQKGWGLQDDFSLPNVHWLGDHTLKTGVRYQTIDLTAQQGSADLNLSTYYWAVTPTGISPTPYEIQFPQLTAGIGSTQVDSKDKQIGVYFQDDWSVNQHLVLNLGIRWDYEKVPAFENYATPANVVQAINGPFPGLTQSYASVLALGGPNYPGYNIYDYISTGSNRHAPTDQFQPRLGFSYDFGADQKNVLFGGYGRSYDRNLFGTLALETTKIALNGNPQVYFPNVPNLDSFGACATAADINPANHCYQWHPAYLTPGNLSSFVTSPTSHEVDLINNHIKTPHSDQLSIGFRHRMGDWNTTVSVADIKSYGTIMGHWGGRYSNGHIYDSTGSQWGAQGVPGIGSLIVWDNGGRDENLQVGLSLQKPYTKESGWSANVAYTYSNAFQNNSSGSPNAYSPLPNQYLFDLPYPVNYHYLPSTAVPKHRLVMTGSVDGPWDLVFAGKLTLATPIPIDGAYGCPNICNIYGGTVQEVSGIPRDRWGYRELDLQVTKNIELPHDLSAYVRLDVLNVFNYYNYDNTAYTWDQSAKPPVYNVTGPIVGVPRTLKLTTGVKW